MNNKDTQMIDGNKILKSYTIRFSEYDNTDTPYYFTIKYGFNGLTTHRLAIDYKDENETTGVDSFNNWIDKIRTWGADFVIIKEYNSNKQGAKQVNGQKDERIPLTTPSAPAEKKEYFKELDSIDENFKGFGGFSGYMNNQRMMMNSDFELMTVKNDKEKLEKENSQHKIRIKELEDENKEMLKANNDYCIENERLDKYDPQNFEKLGLGFNPVTVGGEMIKEGVKSFLSNAKLPSGLSGFFGNKEQESEASHQQQNSQPVQEAQSSHPSAQYNTENLSAEQQAHLDAVNLIYSWLANMKTGDLKKVQQVLNYFYDKEHDVNEENLNLIIELITNPQNSENNE